MIDYIIQNFNLVTFFLALGFFVIVSNIINFIASYIKMRRAQKEAGKAEAELAKLKGKLKAKDEELGDLLSKKEGK